MLSAPLAIAPKADCLSRLNKQSFLPPWAFAQGDTAKSFAIEQKEQPALSLAIATMMFFSAKARPEAILQLGTIFPELVVMIQHSR